MKKIGIIGAMEEEVAVLKDMMEIQEVRTIAGMEFCRGICENPVSYTHLDVYKRQVP